jgi:hypothetical protein
MKIIRWQNDMVMVFDDEGEQVPHLQGHYTEVIDEVLNTPGAEYFHGVWNEDWQPVSKDEF